MLIYLPLLVCLVGLLIYYASANGKHQAVGKDMFWVGLLVTLFEVAGHMVSLLK